MAEALIHQLAQQQGLDVDGNGDVELPDPLDSVGLWVAWMKGIGRSERTIHLYERDVRQYLAVDPHPTPLTLEAWAAKRLDTVSPARVSSQQKSLKSLFKYLFERGLWSMNPTSKMTLIKEPRREIECPSDDAIMKLFGMKLKQDRHEQKFKTMLFLLINTGLRIEEACSMRRPLINLEQHEVTVLGKGNKERTVPISGYVAGLLEAFMDTHPTDSPYLFPGNTKTGYWDSGGFRDSLALACKRLGIRHIHPHQLRHYFATRTLEHGAKLEVISKILGHADVGITVKVYRHIQAKEFHAEHEAHDPLTQLPNRPLLTTGQKEVIEGTVIDEK